MFKRILKLFKGSKSEISKNEITGQVSYLNFKKGFGFIQSPQIEDRIFVHFTDSKDKLRKGSTVRFKLDKTNKGYRALDVLVAN